MPQPVPQPAHVLLPHPNLLRERRIAAARRCAVLHLALCALELLVREAVHGPLPLRRAHLTLQLRNLVKRLGQHGLELLTGEQEPAPGAQLLHERRVVRVRARRQRRRLQFLAWREEEHRGPVDPLQQHAEPEREQLGPRRVEHHGQHVVDRAQVHVRRPAARATGRAGAGAAERGAPGATDGHVGVCACLAQAQQGAAQLAGVELPGVGARRAVRVEVQRSEALFPHVAVEGRLDRGELDGHEHALLPGQHHFVLHLLLGVPDADRGEQLAQERHQRRRQDALPHASSARGAPHAEEPEACAQVVQVPHGGARDGDARPPAHHGDRLGCVPADQLHLVHHHAQELELHQRAPRALVLGRMPHRALRRGARDGQLSRERLERHHHHLQLARPGDERRVARAPRVARRIPVARVGVDAERGRMARHLVEPLQPQRLGRHNERRADRLHERVVSRVVHGGQAAACRLGAQQDECKHLDRLAEPHLLGEHRAAHVAVLHAISCGAELPGEQMQEQRRHGASLLHGTRHAHPPEPARGARRAALRRRRLALQQEGDGAPLEGQQLCLQLARLLRLWHARLCVQLAPAQAVVHEARVRARVVRRRHRRRVAEADHVQERLGRLGLLAVQRAGRHAHRDVHVESGRVRLLRVWLERHARAELERVALCELEGDQEPLGRKHARRAQPLAAHHRERHERLVAVCDERHDARKLRGEELGRRGERHPVCHRVEVDAAVECREMRGARVCGAVCGGAARGDAVRQPRADERLARRRRAVRAVRALARVVVRRMCALARGHRELRVEAERGAVHARVLVAQHTHAPGRARLAHAQHRLDTHRRTVAHARFESDTRAKNAQRGTVSRDVPDLRAPGAAGPSVRFSSSSLVYSG